jgi:hypothetical protein
MESWVFYLIAAVLLVLIPFMPALVRIRIRLLRWIHWYSLADLLENHFENWVLVFRVVVFVLSVVLVLFGWRSDIAG